LKKINLELYDAVIFDLGGVILDINYNKTAVAFCDLGLENFDEMYSQANQSGLFDSFETGRISSQYFVNQILNYLPKGITANQVVDAWNAMILEFPLENITFLKQLKQKKNIFLLSNTNEIHIQLFHRKINELVGEKSLQFLFNKVYYSNEIGLRKPNTETFDFVCKENKLIPENVLFIDDSFQHINGAKSIGLNTFFLEKPQKLIEYLEC
jgi:FMN phosphatase YigB (HAD superfamily)